MATIEQMAAVYRRRAHLPLRTRLLVTFGAVAALHAAAVVLLVAGAAGGGQPLGIGLVLTAYLAGVKHSYDWDHLAAIDNSTRKFAAEHRDPVSVGFAFSLGHSSVVVLAGVLVVAGASLMGNFMEEGTAGNLLLGLIGSAVSGLFLLAMGAFNGSAFLRTLKVYRGARDGAAISHEDLAARGFVARLLARPLARVQHPRNIYVIGFLFGLGFDTATTIGLLVMATAASLAGVSPLALLALPLAFAAAMTLCDTDQRRGHDADVPLGPDGSAAQTRLQCRYHGHFCCVRPLHCGHHPGRGPPRGVRARGPADQLARVCGPGRRRPVAGGAADVRLGRGLAARADILTRRLRTLTIRPRG